jgi:hypothetical protein
MENTYDYIFWYNYLNKTWYAIPRDNYLAFFGKGDETGVIVAKTVKKLIDFIKEYK